MPGSDVVSHRPAALPLVIDLDETLVSSGLLYESFFADLLSGISHNWRGVRALCKGRAQLAAFLALNAVPDYATLPYNDSVVDLARSARSQGRKVYLATAGDRRHAEAIAAHLGVFDGVFASDGKENLKGASKARKLVEAFGERGFEYAGDGREDLDVWARAAKGYAVRANAGVRRRIGTLGIPMEYLGTASFSVAVWLKALRVHQYAKNTLVFVPLITAHALNFTQITSAFVAFLAFSMCASSAYLVNDIADLKSDRRHPTKRHRPIASGDIPLAHILPAIVVLLLGGATMALALSPSFLAVAIGYYVMTLSYSFYLKKKMLIDVVVLAILYTVRVVGGAVAIDVHLSEWILAFSLFIFTSLALIKRYVELSLQSDGEFVESSARDYKVGDIDVVTALAAASAMNAITIFALYISTPAVGSLYSRPFLLWLICPILLYWLGRSLMMAHRKLMDDDPIVFALRDPISRWTLLLIIAVVLLAT